MEKYHQCIGFYESFRLDKITKILRELVDLLNDSFNVVLELGGEDCKGFRLDLVFDHKRAVKEVLKETF